MEKAESPEPMRELVLAGAFFGSGNAGGASALAAFLANRPEDALLAWFGKGRLAQPGTDADKLRLAIDRDIACIDAMISEQLDAVLHHPRLRRLEGSWRGLAWLTAGVEHGARVKIKVLDVRWAEICRDFERAIEFDQSNLFHKIYEEEFGTPGGEPYGLLVVDHEVRHRPGPGAPTDDVGVITSLSSVAAAAFAPTILAASPALLQADSFADLATAADLSDPFRGPDYDRWRGLGSREDMRFIGVTLPRLLTRTPWQDDPARIDGFRYAEHAPDAESRVWMVAGYAFASVVVRAFANYSWPADVRGSEVDRVGGGLVTNLPVESFRTDPEHVWVRPPLDLLLTDQQEKSLADAGLIPLSMLPYGEQPVFGAIQSLHTPPSYHGPTADAARANARISAQINAMLCASRFAHYIKIKGREATGSFQTAEEIENDLQRWLTAYVNATVDGGSDTNARYPLADAHVSIQEQAGRPGVFLATIHLQPHFQLDYLSAAFRLVTEIAAPGARLAA